MLSHCLAALLALPLSVHPPAPLRAAPSPGRRSSVVSMSDGPTRPLLMLKDLTHGQNAAERMRTPVREGPAVQYCKYDAIRELTRAARERSRAQGRDGCCSKAASYLETTTRRGAGESERSASTPALSTEPTTRSEARRARPQAVDTTTTAVYLQSTVRPVHTDSNP
ncbi:hypothetical protein AB1Y20_014626 [Prymnesium parvum]|uniref:Uncharacterized protein n=1 Tax=Prymnesium parvum TaxID=97485 RepID=A0AB34IDM7_PRYPA